MNTVKNRIRIQKAAALCLIAAAFFVFRREAGGIEIRKAALDFGSVKKESIVTLGEEIRNNESRLLHVGIRPSCDCISIDKKRFSLRPGQTEHVTVTANTHGYSGEFAQQIFIQSNSADNPYVTIPITGKINEQPGRETEELRTPQGSIERPQDCVVSLTLFDSAGCLFCRKLRTELLPRLEKTYGVTVKAQEYDVSVKNNYEKLIALEKRYGKELNSFPVLFIGSDMVAGKEEILAKLPALLQKYRQAGGCREIEVPEIAASHGKEAQGKLKFMPVLVAGLIDSINPCAFATIIFFLSYMSLVLKKERYEILATGIVFIAGVYIAYFLLGVGIFSGIQKLKSFQTASKLLYLAMGVGSFYLAYRHGYEAILVRKKGVVKEDDIKLRLPDTLRMKIYDLIKKMTQTRAIVPFVFASAILITILEFVCTGQVYLPTIAYLVSLQMYRFQVMLYLLFYCLLFIAPLVVLFVLFYFGLTTEKIKRFFAGEVVIAKIVMALFFLCMGALLLYQLY